MRRRVAFEYRASLLLTGRYLRRVLESFTPYLYSAYEGNQADPTDKPKITSVTWDPNRIGRGIEFTIGRCCHAGRAPETFSWSTAKRF